MNKLLFIVALFCCSLGYSQNNNDALHVYSTDSVFVSSYDYNGLKQYLHKNEDKTYVINFWATWCLPCVKELPYFEALNENYKNKNVKVILVSLDFPNKVESNLIPFIKKKKLQTKVVHLNDSNANFWINEINKEWSGALPATIIYKGNTRKFYEQSFTYDELEKQLQSILN